MTILILIIMIRWNKGAVVFGFFSLVFSSSFAQGFDLPEMEMLLSSNIAKFESHVIGKGYIFSEERSENKWLYYVDTVTAMEPRPNYLICETSTGALTFTTVDENIYHQFQQSLTEAGYTVVAEDSARAFPETLKTRDYMSITGKYYCVLAERTSNEYKWYNIRLTYAYNRD